MAHLQNYAEQMGGFDFSLTQRYSSLHLETNCCKIKKSLNRCLTKKQVPPSWESNLQRESFQQQTLELLEDLQSWRRTARRFIMLLLTFMLAEQELRLILSSSIFFNPPISNFNDLILVVRLELALILPPQPIYSTSTKDSSVPISLWADMM